MARRLEQGFRVACTVEDWIHLRGEDLGHSDYKFSSSQRVHFIAEASKRGVCDSLR